MTLDGGGRSEIVTSIETFPFCIDWLPDGRLLVVSGGDARVLRREPDGSLVPHADLSGISEQPWNEIVVDDHGNAYVNSIGFDLMAGEAAAPGSVGLVTPDGSVRQVAENVEFPNGMVVTPDGSTLILAESYASRLTAFDIEAAGDLANRRVWAPLDDAPDGICLDAEGAVWYADVPNRRCVQVAEGGDVRATIELDRGCFSCALGGDDGRTLFMVTAEWHGPANPTAARTGQAVTVEAPSPAARSRAS